MQEPCQDNVKLLPDELTEEELSEVIGGRTEIEFERWKKEYLNKFSPSVI
jgi:bacteriocin-like protein